MIAKQGLFFPQQLGRIYGQKTVRSFVANFQNLRLDAAQPVSLAI